MILMPLVNIYAGGCCGSIRGPGAWAVIIMDNSGIREIRGRIDNDSTANRVMLEAQYKALRAICPGSIINMYSSSSFITKGMSKWIHDWKNNHWRTKSGKPISNLELWRNLYEESLRHKVNWVAVPITEEEGYLRRAEFLAHMSLYNID